MVGPIRTARQAAKGKKYNRASLFNHADFVDEETLSLLGWPTGTVLKGPTALNNPPDLHQAIPAPPMDSTLVDPSEPPLVATPFKKQQMYRDYKEQTETRWAGLIPKLLPIYAWWCSQTKNGRECLPTKEGPCCRKSDTRTRVVQAVALFSMLFPPFRSSRLNGLTLTKANLKLHVGCEQISMSYCTNCSSLPLALAERGLFPSSPVLPAFAFDFSLLEHVSTLFLYMTPNVEGWVAHFTDLLIWKGYMINKVQPQPSGLGKFSPLVLAHPLLAFATGLLPSATHECTKAL